MPVGVRPVERYKWSPKRAGKIRWQLIHKLHGRAKVGETPSQAWLSPCQAKHSPKPCPGGLSSAPPHRKSMTCPQHTSLAGQSLPCCGRCAPPAQSSCTEHTTSTQHPKSAATYWTSGFHQISLVMPVKLGQHNRQVEHVSDGHAVHKCLNLLSSSRGVPAAGIEPAPAKKRPSWQHTWLQRPMQTRNCKYWVPASASGAHSGYVGPWGGSPVSSRCAAPAADAA